MRIGIISDTHGLLRPEAEETLAGVDHILHAGDIGAPDIVPRLAAIAPTTAIRGNVDTADWAREFPEEARIRFAGCTILVLHDLGRRTPPEDVDVVVSGHSHQPRIGRAERVLHINPGSAGRRRFRLPVTLATLETADGDLRAVIHRLID